MIHIYLSLLIFLTSIPTAFAMVGIPKAMEIVQGDPSTYPENFDKGCWEKLTKKLNEKYIG